ncbi:MAG TPA: hypothetical protein VKD71_00355 [Gemmataceae bacterium]|nr:hypothetical protein [Gemmataceae bacterium]
MTDDDLLTPKPTTGNEPLKGALLSHTVGRIHFDRRVRLVGRAGFCVACFAAGLFVALLRPAPEPTTVYVQVPVPAPPVADAPGSPALVRVPSPAQIELEAEKTLVRAEAARRFREAGDLYLNYYADYKSALRCYRNFLDEADPADRRIASDDTWLLTSLKRAREQESAQ